MLSTIKYTILEMLRLPGIIIWSLVFPIVLMSVFSVMFGPLDEMEDLDPIRITVVEPDGSTVDAQNASYDHEAFSEFIDALSEGKDRLLAPTWVSDTNEAKQMVTDSISTDDPFVGYVELVDGKPQVNIADARTLSGFQDIEASILAMVMDEYTAKAAMLKEMIAADPAALADPSVLGSVFERIDSTVQVDVTRNQPRESVRYYFALLGMAALFGANVSLIAFQRMRPNMSALGARRMIGALSHGKAVGATLIACWIVGFVCLLVAYAFLRLVVGIDFGGRDLACLLVTAVASIVSMSLGCAVAAIPKVPEEGKSGILTGIVCFASLFAGLYGQPTMALADLISENAPIVAWINPATQISQAFYSVMYYDDLLPMMSHLLALLVISAVLFCLAVGSLRRQRYASI